MFPSFEKGTIAWEIISKRLHWRYATGYKQQLQKMPLKHFIALLTRQHKFSAEMECSVSLM